MQIPVRNLYLLLSYAWDALDLSDLIEVGAEDLVEPRDLVAQVLLQGVNHVFRRGIDHGYAEANEETAMLHGRVAFGRSIGLMAKRSNRLIVEFEEWSPDTQANRVVKAALKRLIGVTDLPLALRHSLAGACRALGAVADIQLDGGAIERVRLHRNNRVYRLLMEAARMVNEHVIPDDAGRGFRFRAILRDEEAMRVLFQKFVYNFLRREQRNFKVSADRFGWNGSEVGKQGDVGLPVMQTDVVLRGQGRTIVLDTKFTPRSFATHWGSRTLRPEHVYQLFAYMANLRETEPARTEVQGILVYPSTTRDGFDLRWSIHGMPLRVTSLALAQEWPVLRGELLALASANVS